MVKVELAIIFRQADITGVKLFRMGMRTEVCPLSEDICPLSEDNRRSVDWGRPVWHFEVQVLPALEILIQFLYKTPSWRMKGSSSVLAIPVSAASQNHYFMPGG